MEEGPIYHSYPPGDATACTDSNGQRWLLDAGGYWWLHNPNGWWHREAHLHAGMVMGIRVPSVTLRPGKSWTAPMLPITQIVSSDAYLGGRDFLNLLNHHLSETKERIAKLDETDRRIADIRARWEGEYRRKATKPMILPEVPPDELIPEDPGSCRDCGMDDVPLYQDRRCRWCRQLVTVQAETDARRSHDEVDALRLRDWLSHFVPDLTFALILVLLIIMILGMAYG